MTEPPLLHRPHPRLHLQGDPPPVQDIDHDAALHQRRFEYRHYYRRVRALSAVYASEHLSLQNLPHLHTFNTLNLLRMLQSCLNTNLTDIPIPADHQQPHIDILRAALHARHQGILTLMTSHVSL